MIKASVIVPCLNEEKFIESLLCALMDQSFTRTEMEVIIVDGLSTDRTRDLIQEFQLQNPILRIELIDNPKKIIPAALNLGIRAAHGEYIIRMDAHSIPEKNYIEKCVNFLSAGKAENVGGRWDIIPAIPESWQSRSIAAAVSHPLGAGDALYRFSETAAFVDTVPFGAFRKSKLIELNCYDENLQSNEDYDLNVRLRKSGGKIWFDPQIRSRYVARANFKDLASQYFRYGFWKRKMLSKYPDSLRLRQAIPPLFMLSLILLIIAGFFLNWIWIGFGIVLGIYLWTLVTVSFWKAVSSKDCGKVLGMPVSFFVIHFSWSAGFLISKLQKG